MLPCAGRVPALLLVLLACSTVAGPVEDAEVTSDDYYRVLGLERDCDPLAVKKHYRKLAMHWHPDKNKAPEAEANFKNIAAAYEILSDEEARQKYDQGGKDALKPENQQRHGGGGGGFNFNFGRNARDIFKDAFDGKDPFENFEEFFGGDGYVEEVIVKDGAACEDEKGVVATDEKGRQYQCSEAKQYCSNAELAAKCKKTCGKCPAGPGGSDVQAPTCEDEQGVVATDEKGRQYQCSEAKQYCSNAGLAAKCKKTCGKCPGGGGGGGDGGGGGSIHDQLRRRMGMMGGFGDVGFGSSSFSSFSSSSSFSSFSSSSSSFSGGGGTTERTETVIENGHRVTKKIRTGPDGETHASIEEEEGGVMRKRSGVKKTGEALPGGGHEDEL